MASTDDYLDAATLDGGIRLLTMKRPAARNALNLALLASLAAEFDAARHDAATTVVVLTGDEKAFSAGADIREMSAKGWDAIEDELRNASWQTMRDFPKPFIAAVRGYALGGGNELAMLADLVIAGEGAVFGQPEAMIGGIPGDGGTQRLPRLVGRQLAMRMFLTGERLSGREAFAAGLVCAVSRCAGCRRGPPARHTNCRSCSCIRNRLELFSLGMPGRRGRRGADLHGRYRAAAGRGDPFVAAPGVRMGDPVEDADPPSPFPGNPPVIPPYTGHGTFVAGVTRCMAPCRGDHRDQCFLGRGQCAGSGSGTQARSSARPRRGHLPSDHGLPVQA